MATPRVTIDQLPIQAAPEDTNELVIQDSGVTKRMTVGALRTVPSLPLADHLADTVDAHDASAVSAAPSGTGVNGTTVQAQLGQLVGEVAGALTQAKAYTDAQIAAGSGGGGVSDVVWVGPDAPPDPAMEMWWDEDAQGGGVYATNAETIAGVITDRSVTPAGLAYERAYLDVRTYGAVGDGVANDAPAIQVALDVANALLTTASNPGATVVFPPGTYNLSTGLTARCSIEMMPGAVLSYTGTGIAVLVDRVNDGRYNLFVKRPAANWDEGADLTSVGVSFRNCNFARGSLNVSNFNIGVEHHGDNTGSSYSNLDLRTVDDCKVGLFFKVTGTGWANQHETHGRIRCSSSVTAAVVGSRYVDMSQGGNGSTFVAMSFEANRVEFSVDCSMNYVQFVNCRWEQASPFRLNTGAYAVIVGGYGNLGHNSASGLQFVDNGGTISNLGYLGAEMLFDGGAAGTGRGLELNAINSPSNVVLTAKASTTGKTYGELQANGTYTGYRNGKGDVTFPAASVVVDPVNRRLSLGDGTAAPLQYIQGTSQTRIDVQSPVFRTLADIEIDGKLDHDGAAVGFYGVNPVARAASPGTATGTDAAVLNAVVTALRNLGLVT